MMSKTTSTNNCMIPVLILLTLNLIYVNNAKDRTGSPTRFYTKNLDEVYSRNTVADSRPGRIMASVGNGYVGTIIYTDTMHVAGIYNGKAVSKQWPIYPLYFYEHTHRARIPSTCAINFTVEDRRGESAYALDVSEGVFYRWFESDDKNFTVEQRIYAHRSRKHLIVVELSVTKPIGENVTLRLSNNKGMPSSDIDFKEHSPKPGVMVGVGEVKQPEDTRGFKATVGVAWTGIPSSLTMTASVRNKTWYFITALTSSISYEKDVVLNETLAQWEEAYRDRESLLQSHKEAWKRLWDTGKIDIEGNIKLSQAVYGSMYYILSSTRADWPYGLSPGGLPGGEEYMGHTFWDQDIWMYPFLVLLHPDLARGCLEYRYQRLPAARVMADKYGFNGAMFPWESSLSGMETSPGDYYGESQIHISGDIAHAAKLYWMATQDYQWLKKIGYQLVKQTADFWASRVYYKRRDRKYYIHFVMPPDEYQFPVDNSIYTNVVAKQNLEFAVKISHLLGRYAPTRWAKIAREMYIPYDKKLKYHPEFDGYNLNMTVKQADTILIGYPLMYDMDKQVRYNDLRFYSEKTTKHGPAMTHAMHAIGWLELGKEKKAHREFRKNYDNIVGPFKVWTEQINKRGAVNFITGAGGFLQAVIYGYGGFRLRENRLDFYPTLPRGCKKLTIRGVHYMGNKLEFEIKKKMFGIRLISKGPISPRLEVVMIYRRTNRYSLRIGEMSYLHRGRGYLRIPRHDR